MNQKKDKRTLKMKVVSFLIVFASIVVFFAGTALADVYVNGYYRSNGTYVQSHHRSNPDGYSGNNWSSAGNVNPYTGATGTRRW